MRDIPIRFDAALDLIAEDSSIADGNEGNGGSIKVGGGQIVKAVLMIGDKSGTNPTLDIHFESSANDSSFTDIEGAAFAQKITSGTAEIVFKVPEGRPYVREVTAVTGTNTPTFTGVHLFLVA